MCCVEGGGGKGDEEKEKDGERQEVQREKLSSGTATPSPPFSRVQYLAEILDGLANSAFYLKRPLQEKLEEEID